MTVKCLPVGYLRANCYIVSDDEAGLCAVIDPGGEPEKILGYLREHALKCGAILLTHAHDDHVGGVYGLKEATSAPVYLHAADIGLTVRRTGRCFREPDDLRTYAEGDELEIGSLRFRIIETPGHTPGGVTIACGRALFTGDTLFKGSTGRADLGGDFAAELRSLRKLALLPGDYEVYPGHADATTLQRESECNPYMKRALEGTEDAQ